MMPADLARLTKDEREMAEHLAKCRRVYHCLYNHEAATELLVSGLSLARSVVEAAREEHSEFPEPECRVCKALAAYDAGSEEMKTEEGL